MKKDYKHFENCDAPICVDDRTEEWQKHVIWYPGETVCLKSPRSSAQKTQIKVNRLLLKGKLRFPYKAYTFVMLSKLRRIDPGIKGVSPNRPDFKTLRGEAK